MSGCCSANVPARPEPPAVVAATKRQTHFVGVDLGGTKILAGVYDAGLKFLGKMKLSTKAERGYEEVPVPADDNCLFHALGDQLGSDHLTVRQELVTCLEAHLNTTMDDGGDGEAKPLAERLKDLDPTGSSQNYLDNMRRIGTWGDEGMLLAASIKYEA